MPKPKIKLRQGSPTLTFVETVIRYGYQPQVCITGPYFRDEHLTVSSQGKNTSHLTRGAAIDYAIKETLRHQAAAKSLPGAFISGN